MKTKDKSSIIHNFEQEIFNIINEPMPKGAWLWWFWLFFIKSTKNTKPRQLIILWSTKNEKRIDCNHLSFRFKQPINKTKFDGSIAAWYFDGKQMHHNFLLEQCNLKLSDKKLSSDSTTTTSYSVNKTKNIIKIGEDFEFTAELGNKHNFLKPYYSSLKYFGKGYSIIRVNRMKLTGKIKNEKITGSAYLQRVYINSPTVPWYWGVFHFDNGSVLIYFNPNLAGKSIKRQISFFDSNKLYKFKKMKVKRIKGKLPVFEISGENKREKIDFKVNPYTHSSWTFKKKVFGILPIKMIYNEYPATISGLCLTDKKTGKNLLIKGLGNNIGNAEHTTGILV